MKHLFLKSSFITTAMILALIFGGNSFAQPPGGGGGGFGGPPGGGGMPGGGMPGGGMPGGMMGGMPEWLNASAEDMPKQFMEYEDQDGDGKVTADEFGGPAEHFTAYDKNADGVIELSEAPTPDTLQ